MSSPIIEKLQWRYACKKFDATRKLPSEKLQVLKDAFNLTATSYGLQPLKMIVIDNTALKEQLVPITMNQKQVNDASHVLVLCVEAEMPSEFIINYFNTIEAVRKTPRSVLAPFEAFVVKDFSEKSKDEIHTWMAKQAYLALGNLLTVCALEEIDACPMEGFEPAAYDKFLGLQEKGLRSVLVLPVGYRAEDDAFASMKKVRRGTAEVIIEM